MRRWQLLRPLLLRVPGAKAWHLSKVRCVVERSSVESVRREERDLRVHAVLRGEQCHLVAAALQPVEERLLVVVLHGRLGKDSRRQLLGITHEDEAPTAVLERNERGDLDCLRGLIDEYSVESLLALREH